VIGPIDGIRAKEAGEEQDFRRQKQPRSELAGIELLHRRVEMVREERRVVVVLLAPRAFRDFF